MTNSICAIQPGYGNTAPVQLELDPGMGRGEEAVQKIADYILTLMELGGTLLNINIIDGQKILEAGQGPLEVPGPGGAGHRVYRLLLRPHARIPEIGGRPYSTEIKGGVFLCLSRS